MLRAFAAAVCLSLPLAAAHAQSQVDFAYNFQNGSTESGVLNGTLAADGNHFTISSIASLSYDGITLTAADQSIFLESVDADVGAGGGYNGNGSAVVTLDGSYLDLITEIASADGSNFIYTYFAVNDVFSGYIGNVSFADADSNQYSEYGDAGWSAALVDIPEPGSLAVMGLGLASLAVIRRRAKRHDVD